MEEDPESRAVTTVNRSSKSPTLEDLGLSHSALAYDNKFVCSPPGMLMLGEIVSRFYDIILHYSWNLKKKSLHNKHVNKFKQCVSMKMACVATVPVT